MTTTVGAFGVVSAPVQSTCLYLPSTIGTIVPQYPVGIRVCTPKGALRVCQLYSCVYCHTVRLGSTSNKCLATSWTHGRRKAGRNRARSEQGGRLGHQSRPMLGCLQRDAGIVLRRLRVR